LTRWIELPKDVDETRYISMAKVARRAMIRDKESQRLSVILCARVHKSLKSHAGEKLTRVQSSLLADIDFDYNLGFASDLDDAIEYLVESLAIDRNFTSNISDVLTLSGKLFNEILNDSNDRITAVCTTALSKSYFRNLDSRDVAALAMANTHESIRIAVINAKNKTYADLITRIEMIVESIPKLSDGASKVLIYYAIPVVESVLRVFPNVRECMCLSLLRKHSMYAECKENHPSKSELNYTIMAIEEAGQYVDISCYFAVISNQLLEFYENWMKRFYIN
jgi:hypothetical protein